MSVIEMLLGGNARTRAGYVETIETIAGFDPETLDRMGMDFDDASVKLVDEDGISKTIRPGDLQAKFTYPAGDLIQMEKVAWIEHVIDVLRGPLSEDVDIQLG